MDRFLLLLAAHAFPVPATEFAFHPPRRWRFDYCWPTAKVAVECEGGAWTGGRHTRGRGYVADCEKYNIAQLDGWIVLRFTPAQLERAETLAMIRTALKGRDDAH